jgi:signal transduction histidine kinase
VIEIANFVGEGEASSKMKVATRFTAKLAAGYVLSIAVVSATSALALVKLVESAHGTGAMMDGAVREILVVERCRGALADADADARGYVATKDRGFLSRADDELRVAESRVASLEATAATHDESAGLHGIDSALARYHDAVDALPVVGQAEPDGERRRIFTGDLVPARAALDRAISVLIAHEERQLSAARISRDHDENGAVAVAAGALVFGVFACTALAITLGAHLSTLYKRVTVAVAAREELLHAVAHDLRSPLSAIRLKAAVLKQRVPEAQTHAVGISGIVDRMDGLIKRLLDVASIEGGTLSVSPVEVSVADLFADTTALFQELAAQKSLALESEGGASLSVRADRERALEVLSNLVGNAVKFTPINGRVVMRARANESVVHFDVVDTGPGIAPKDLPRVFDRFYRAEAARGGNGLGLSIAKGIVEAHGGRIGCESTYGHGARFWFTLPRA